MGDSAGNIWRHKLRWTNSGAVSGFDCTPQLNTIYSKHADTHISSFCLISGPDTLFKSNLVPYSTCNFGMRNGEKEINNPYKARQTRKLKIFALPFETSNHVHNVSVSLFGSTAQHSVISIRDLGKQKLQVAIMTLN
jgi:hypothetical protein